MRRVLIIFGALMALFAGPAQAETLRIAGIYPATSNEAAALRSIAVERFDGQDGSRLSFLIEDRLRQATIGGQPWLTVLVPQLADEADAVLQGFAEPRFAETSYTEERDGCITRAEDGTCTETGKVQAQCTRVTVSLRPSLRLVALDGRVLWTSEPQRSQDFSWCRDFDDRPQVDSVIDQWIEAIASETRYALVPYYDARNIRIMESRTGLRRADRGRFREAIALTRSSDGSPCEMFEELLEANPESPSLIFNAGLCAEQRDDFDRAEAIYRQALAFESSDDEARAGLSRISQRRRGLWQLNSRQ